MGLSPEDAFRQVQSSGKPTSLSPSEAFGSSTPEPQGGKTLAAVSDAFKTVKDSAFIKRSTSALRTAADAVKDNPTGALNATGDALFAGAVDMVNLSMSGIAALAKSMFTPVKVDPRLSIQEQAKQNFDKSIAQFTANQQKIKLSLDGVNNAPPDKQQEAMQGVLGILPDAINAAGDTVFEKTGSALLGAGTAGILAVLSMNPEIAGKTLNKIADVSRTKGINTRVSASFEELAATNPEGAEALANHIEIVDSKAAQYMRGRIEALKDASESTLDEIGKRKADAEIAELQKNLEDQIRQDNFVPEPGLSTGEGKGKRTKSRTGSAPSGYSELGREVPPEPEVGLSTGEGVATPRKSRTKSAPSGYGTIVDQDYSGTSGERYDTTIKGKTGPAPVEEEFGLGTGEGKASKARGGSRSGPSGYGKNLTESSGVQDPSTGVVISPERMSASLRNAVMEGHDAIAKVRNEAVSTEGQKALYTVNNVPVTRDDFGRFSNLDNFWDCT